MKDLWEAIKTVGPIWLAFGVVITAITIGKWLVSSYYEAKTYSELTGKQVSMGQALWVQFRVVEPAKSD